MKRLYFLVAGFAFLAGSLVCMGCSDSDYSWVSPSEGLHKVDEDSLAVADSIARADSIWKADSLSTLDSLAEIDSAGVWNLNFSVYDPYCKDTFELSLLPLDEEFETAYYSVVADIKRNGSGESLDYPIDFYRRPFLNSADYMIAEEDCSGLQTIVSRNDTAVVKIDGASTIAQKRVIALMQKGSSFEYARNKAEREVYSAFGFNLDTLESEQERYEASVVISSVVALTSRRNVAELQSYIGEGKFSKKDIFADVLGGFPLSKIEGVVSSFILPGTPAREKSHERVAQKLYDIWLAESGLGVCDSARTGGVARHAKSKLNVDSDVSFTCENLKWRYSTALEYAFSAYECKDDGQLLYEQHNVNDAPHYTYWICYHGDWMPSDDLSLEVPKDFYFNENLEYGYFQDSRDSKIYRTSFIGDRLWLAENMNIADSSVGTCYDADIKNCEVFGKLYTYEEALNACPSGMHLPTAFDFAELRKEAGNASGLISKIGWRWNVGYDDLGFSAIAAGNFRGMYDNAHYVASFWTADDVNELKAKVFMLVNDESGVDALVLDLRKEELHSVRCVGD